MQAKYLELVQIPSRPEISDPLRADAPERTPLYIVSLVGRIFGEFITGQYKVGHGVIGTAKFELLFGCEFTWNIFEISPISNSPLTRRSTKELGGLGEPCLHLMVCSRSSQCRHSTGFTEIPASCARQTGYLCLKHFVEICPVYYPNYIQQTNAIFQPLCITLPRTG